MVRLCAHCFLNAENIDASDVASFSASYNIVIYFDIFKAKNIVLVCCLRQAISTGNISIVTITIKLYLNVKLFKKLITR